MKTKRTQNSYLRPAKPLGHISCEAGVASTPPTGRPKPISLNISSTANQVKYLTSQRIPRKQNQATEHAPFLSCQAYTPHGLNHLARALLRGKNSVLQRIVRLHYPILETTRRGLYGQMGDEDKTGTSKTSGTETHHRSRDSAPCYIVRVLLHVGSSVLTLMWLAISRVPALKMCHVSLFASSKSLFPQSKEALLGAVLHSPSDLVRHSGKLRA